jgi:hypothetical protein
MNAGVQAVQVAQLGPAGAVLLQHVQAALADGGAAPDVPDANHLLERLLDLLARLAELDEVHGAISVAESNREVRPLVGRRRTMASELAPKVVAALAEATVAVTEREQQLLRAGARLEVLAELPGGDEAARGVPPVALTALGTLRRAVQAAVGEFGECFSLAAPAEGPAGCVLGSAAVGLIRQLQSLYIEHAASFGALAAGQLVEPAIMEAQRARREKLEVLLEGRLSAARATFSVLLRAATHLDAAQRVAAEGGAAAMAAGVGEGGVTLSLGEATQFVQAGGHSGARGGRLLMNFLQERAAALAKLPDLEAEAAAHIRRVGRADRNVAKLRAKVQHYANRRAEVERYGELSEEEEKVEESEGLEELTVVSDDELTVHSTGELGDRLSCCDVRLNENVAAAAAARRKLAALAVQLPELLLHPKLTSLDGTPGAATSTLSAWSSTTGTSSSIAAPISGATLSGCPPASPAAGAARMSQGLRLSPALPPRSSFAGVTVTQSVPWASRRTSSGVAAVGRLGSAPVGEGLSPFGLSPRGASEADIMAQRVALEKERRKLERQLADIHSRF